MVQSPRNVLWQLQTSGYSYRLACHLRHPCHLSATLSGAPQVPPISALHPLPPPSPPFPPMPPDSHTQGLAFFPPLSLLPRDAPLIWASLPHPRRATFRQGEGPSLGHPEHHPRGGPEACPAPLSLRCLLSLQDKRPPGKAMALLRLLCMWLLVAGTQGELSPRNAESTVPSPCRKSRQCSARHRSQGPARVCSPA